MSLDLRFQTWQKNQLVLSEFRSSGVGREWGALVAEGEFLPSSGDGTEVRYGKAHDFVATALWRFAEELHLTVRLERPTGMENVRSLEQIGSLVDQVIGEDDYRFAYLDGDELKALAFDIDITWLVLICAADLEQRADTAFRETASTLGLSVVADTR